MPIFFLFFFHNVSLEKKEGRQSFFSSSSFTAAAAAVDEASGLAGGRRVRTGGLIETQSELEQKPGSVVASGGVCKQMAVNKVMITK